MAQCAPRLNTNVNIYANIIISIISIISIIITSIVVIIISIINIIIIIIIIIISSSSSVAVSSGVGPVSASRGVSY